MVACSGTSLFHLYHVVLHNSGVRQEDSPLVLYHMAPSLGANFMLNMKKDKEALSKEAILFLFLVPKKIEKHFQVCMPMGQSFSYILDLLIFFKQCRRTLSPCQRSES